jgi:hypothetical protein
MLGSRSAPIGTLPNCRDRKQNQRPTFIRHPGPTFALEHTYGSRSMSLGIKAAAAARRYVPRIPQPTPSAVEPLAAGRGACAQMTVPINPFERAQHRYTKLFVRSVE